MKHAAWSVLARSVLSAVLLLLAARDATQAQGAPPAADTTGIAARCRAPEHRQFDFWLGAWDVRNSDGQLLGHNEIQRVAGGCALLEVRQAWDISVDGGKSWTSSFVGFYSRAGERGGGESPARVRSPLEASHPSLE